MPEIAPSAPIDGLPGVEPALPLEGGWSDAQALKIAKSDFQQAETFRQQNIEPRWREADRTYLAWTGGGRCWDGTRIPRANMQVFLAYQQIEVLMPQVMDAIFGQDLTFNVAPGAVGTTIQQCLAIHTLLGDQFNRLNCGTPNFISLREIFRRMEKESFIYGNGIAELGWENYKANRTKYSRGILQRYGSAVYNGDVIQVPLSQYEGVIPTPEEYTVNKPFLTHTTIKDFYIDPNTPAPNVQEARYCAHRKLITIARLQEYRDRDGFMIPSDKRLYELSKKTVVTSGDTSKQVADSYGGYSTSPTLSQTSDPRQMFVEVIRYWQKDRHVWMLGREDVALNRENPYGVLPFLGTYYTDFPNRFYALSICDLTEGDQNLAAELLNARLDELNLILHPPFIAKLGSFLATSAAKFRPGGKFELANPKEDLIRMEMGNVTATAFVEVDQIDRRVAKTVGVSDTAGFGISSAGGNSALRSATGVQSQTNAQSSRVHYLVANVEDQFMLPLLNIFWGLNKIHMDPQQKLQLLGPDGNALDLDPVEMLNADPRFSMQTASKMKARAALQNGGLNVFFQGLLNPSVLEGMAEQQNLVPDYPAICEMFCDVFNQKAQSFFKQMTPEEQQMRQARMLAPLQAKQQLQDSRLQVMSDDAKEANETALIIKILDVMQKAGLINDLADVKRDIEISADNKKAMAKKRLSNGK